MLMFGLFMGAQRVVFSLLMAKVIPISRRGRLQAWRNFTGSAIAAVLAYFAGPLLHRPEPVRQRLLRRPSSSPSS